MSSVHRSYATFILLRHLSSISQDPSRGYRCPLLIPSLLTPCRPCVLPLGPSLPRLRLHLHPSSTSAGSSSNNGASACTWGYTSLRESPPSVRKPPQQSLSVVKLLLISRPSSKRSKQLLPFIFGWSCQSRAWNSIPRRTCPCRALLLAQQSPLAHAPPGGVTGSAYLPKGAMFCGHFRDLGYTFRLLWGGNSVARSLRSFTPGTSASAGVGVLVPNTFSSITHSFSASYPGQVERRPDRLVNGQEKWWNRGRLPFSPPMFFSATLKLSLGYSGRNSLDTLV